MVFQVVNVRRHALGQTQPPAEPQAPPPQEPAAPSGPQPRWVTPGAHDLLPTLAAVGTVAALAIAGVALLK